MKRIASLLILVLFLSQNIIAQEKRPLKNLDVFDMEWAADPQISPQGDRIVYLRRGFDIMKDGTQTQLWIVNSDGSGHRLLFQGSASSPRWSPNGQQLAYTSGGQIHIYDFATKQSTEITSVQQSPSGISWSPDGQHLAFSMFIPTAAPSLVAPPKKPKGAQWAEPVRVTTRLKYEADGRGYLPDGFRYFFIVPSEGGKERQLTFGEKNHSGSIAWLKDGSGFLFSGNLNDDWEYDFRNSEIYHLDLASGELKALTDRNGPDGGAVISPDGEKVLYTGYDDRVQTYQLSKVYSMNIDGSGKKEIDLQLDRDPGDLQWSADGNGFYFMFDEHGQTKIGFHDLKKGKTETVVSSLGGTTLGRPYGGGSYSLASNGQIVYTSCTAYRPSDVAVVKKGQSAQQLTDLNKDVLDFIELGKVESVWYKSSFDGRDVQGWVVTPPNYDPNRKYPLLVENHGGPISNYGERFSLEVQLYAADGFVVFYPNPRGSTGYGEEFGNLLYHNYPGNDYDDVMSGVDLMIEKGYTSEDSLFVTGGSAGGIMTAWMIGKNDRFESAAVIKPVINWVSKTLMADNYYGYANSRFPGQPWENIETYMNFSPISLVGNVQTPTLVMVGMEDKRTPPSEAKQYYGALKIRKIPTALVELPGASHGIASRPSQLIAKVDNILAWFKRYRK